MQIEKIDVAIVGGGIVGLWTAYELLVSQPGISLVLYEKEHFLGEHSTGRNSEVLHSGIYYETGSLKHSTCLEGNALWKDFIQKHKIGYLSCGKYVVARENEQERFEKLFENARANQVPKVRMASAKEISSLREEVLCSEAFFCPTSGVLSVSEAVRVLSGLVEQAGGILIKNEQFKILEFSSDGFIFQSEGDFFKASKVVNAAGHFAVDLRSQLMLKNYSNRFVKGSYLLLKNKLNLKTLVYPIPPAHGLGLGVHLTLDISGMQKFGPNTEDISHLDYSLDENIIDQMFPSISELFPRVKKENLALAYSGIRSKILNSCQELQKDFILGTPQQHGIEGYFEFLGIESPGLTSSPALARLMRHQMDF